MLVDSDELLLFQKVITDSQTIKLKFPSLKYQSQKMEKQNG